MKDLRDEFLKAGLAGKHLARDIERGKRAEKRKVDRASSRKTEADTSHALYAKSREKRSAPTESQAKSAKAPDADSIRKMISAGIAQQAPGNRRFYFVDSDGRIPFMEVGEETIRSLTNGVLAIVESMGATKDEFVLVDRETVSKLESGSGAVIRFWNSARRR